MISYWVIHNILKNIKDDIDAGNYEKAKLRIKQLKNDLADYLKQIFKILTFIEESQIPKELYNLILQNVTEISLDLNGAFGDIPTIENNREVVKKSKISEILEKIKNQTELSFFEDFMDVISDIMIFLEYYEEPRIPSSDLKTIESKINNFLQKYFKKRFKNVHSSR